ncbi:MAG: hypothetical protein JO292_11840 [Betaproteobacteria bacterium]|nr:hypothetical protein [Betaproteobacteria bacterium]MBV9362070.1 hypothetical protein [Betaproteobacteria bacterium]
MEREGAETPQAAAKLAEHQLEKGEPLLAYNELQGALERWPHHGRLRQLSALALARAGDLERANEILRTLVAEGLDDAETLGLLARTHKGLALDSDDPARRSEHLGAGFALYERAYRDARSEGRVDAAWYTGINAATMALLRGELARAKALAAEVRDVCLEAAAPSDATPAAYWREATLGEAALILGEADAAGAHYARAVQLAKGRYGDVASTRKQARVLAAALPNTAQDALEALAIPPVVVFTGHMMERPGQRMPLFPGYLEAGVHATISDRLARIAPLAVYGSAACGVDLLCLEVAHRLGAETHIVLPFPAAEFRAVSVDFAGGDWGVRFERALDAADSVTIASGHYARDSSASFEYANLMFTGMGRLRAETLDAPLRALAVWDRAAAGEPGGSASLVRFWEAQGLHPEHVDLGALRSREATADASRAAQPSAPAPSVRHEIRAMLFADAVGYSRLSEDQIPAYIEGFLGMVAELNRRTSHPCEHVETAGDGLYMVFRSATDAAQFALELREAMNRFDRAAWGLPADFGLRVALHCGPVHCGRDPITGRPLYTGPHTSRTARIEPITPPGQVYASSPFAAVVAASGDDFALSYVGRMPLAKGYGMLGLYHLRGGRSGAMAH